MPALVIHKLSKVYKNGVHALKEVDLTVEAGDFFALLGPNGAGKSTLIGILTSLVRKTAGKVSVFGYDIDKDFAQAKSCLGVVPQEFNFNIFETVEKIVTLQAGYYGVPYPIAKERAEKYLKKFELWDKRHARARSLSGGMKRRLMIVRALLHEPKILILDEPTAGVDIELRRQTWRLLTELNQQGITIILTTHYLEEAETLCRNIAIINHGKIIENASMPLLLQKLESERFIFYLQAPLLQTPTFINYKSWLQDPLTLEVEVQKEQGLSGLFQQLQQQQINVASMRNKANRLEELFVRLTGGEHDV